MGRRERPISRTCGVCWLVVGALYWREGERGAAHKSGKGQFEEEEVCGALVATDFAEGDGAGFVAARFAGGGCFCLRGCQ